MQKTYSDAEIESVWQKGNTVPGQSPSSVRKDACGATIYRSKYADRGSTYGWEIDHINPNGSDYISNLRPLQWENNLAKSDGPLKCVRTT